MKIFCLFFLIIFSLNGFTQCPIIPTPESYIIRNFHIEFDSEFRADSTTFNAENWNFFKKELKKVTSLELIHAEDDEALVSVLSLDDSMDDSPNGYAMSISKRERVIMHRSDASQFYALVSLLQLFEVHDGIVLLKSCEIEDNPRFDWRGLHLDVSRHFFTVQEVKRYIDLMALYKYNVFHWHLTDDQGWRIEIKKYPKLTEIGAFRDSTVIGHYSDTPRAYEVEKYGGFYTQDQIKEVVEYASLKYITVVPEIEMPGHSRAALASYPELSCTSTIKPVPGLWGVFDDIYCSKSESIQFMKDVLEEVLALFPSEYIHVGGDEAPKVRWRDCNDCQRVIKDNDLKDEHELQSYFIQQIDSYLTSKGRKLIGWDEILEGGLSDNAAVMSWRGTKGGKEAALQKHEVVMSPTTYCYFDYYQSASPSEPRAIGGYLPMKKVYEFDPIPEGLPQNLNKFILGGQANLWTEYIPDMQQLEYMTYPRALALSQSLWSMNKPLYEEFVASFVDYHEHFLQRHDVNFATAVHHPKFELSKSESGIHISVKSDVLTDEFIVTRKENGLNKGEKRISALDAIKLERTPPKEFKLVQFEVKSTANESLMSQDFYLHRLVGADVAIHPLPHAKFNTNGQLAVVDGIVGRRPWIGSEWLGFTEKQIEFTLYNVNSNFVDSLKIGFLKDNGSWIYLPKKVRVLVADHSDWENAQEEFSSTSIEEKFSIHIGREAMNIRIIVDAMEFIPQGLDGEGHTPWTFIDEIRIIE